MQATTAIDDVGRTKLVQAGLFQKRVERDGGGFLGLVAIHVDEDRLYPRRVSCFPAFWFVECCQREVHIAVFR